MDEIARKSEKSIIFFSGACKDKIKVFSGKEAKALPGKWLPVFLKTMLTLHLNN